jgi:hypothetical protein
LTAQEASGGARNARAVDGQHWARAAGRIGIPSPCPSLSKGINEIFLSCSARFGSATSRKSCHLVPLHLSHVHVHVHGVTDGLSSHSAQNGTRGTPHKDTLSDPNNGLPSRLGGPAPIVLVTIPRVSTLWEACWSVLGGLCRTRREVRPGDRRTPGNELVQRSTG